MQSPPSPTAPPTATGTFAKTPLPHLLIYAIERRLSGSFELALGGAAVAAFQVYGGFPAKVRLAEPILFLGTLMTELGMITAEQAAAAWAARQADPTKLPGQHLVEQGATTSEAVDGALRAQIDRKVEHLFGLPSETTYAYYDAVDRLEGFGGGPMPIDPYPVLWRGVRTSPSWEHVDATLRRAGTAFMRIAPSAQPERFGFTAQELQAIEAMRQRPLRLLDVTSMLGPSVGQVFTYFLMLLKQVELVDGSQVRAPASGATPPSAGQAFARVQLTKSARNPVFREEVVAQVKDERASSPARAAEPPAEGTGAAIAQTISSLPPAAPVPAAPVPAAAAATSPPAPPGPPASLTPEQTELKAKILERADKISAQNYFEMLGVPRDATAEQIQKAFFALAKVWHPDRLPPALADVKEACGKVFTHITEAHATLSDAGKRQDYLTLMRDGGATPDDQAKIMAILEAATEFQKAEFLMKRNLTDPQAYDLVRKAVSLDPDQTDYRATLAWLDAQKPEFQAKDKTLETIAILDRCTTKNPNCERAVFYRGLLWKRAGDPARALKDFKRASELNPKNLDAVREVRLSAMRAGQKPPGASVPPGRTSKPPTSDKSGGFLGKLFKK